VLFRSVINLAYRREQTQIPPTLPRGETLPANLVIDFAPIEDSYFADWNHPDPAIQETYAHLRAWAEITASGNLWAWLYPNPWGTGISMLVGNVGRLVTNMRLMHQAGVRGVFTDHSSYIARGGWSELQAQLFYRLSQDIDADADGLADGCDNCPNVPTANGTFSNAGVIAIPDFGAASPYPSAILVSGLAAPVQGLTVTLHGLTHGFPRDISVLLVGPTGINAVLMRFVGDGTDISNIDLTFTDGAPPITEPIVSGTYSPTILASPPPFPAPAPGSPYGHMLSAFNGTDGNGIWELYVLLLSKMKK